MNTFNTQIQAACNGTITPQMYAVAEREHREPVFIRDLVAAGRAVIPANIKHTNLVPIGIGAELNTKVNANIGNSSLSSNEQCELEKLDMAVIHGADTVMDLSTGKNVHSIRQAIINSSTVPVGTVPIYEAVCRVDKSEDLTANLLFEVIEEQAEQGVDYMTVHAGILHAHVPLTKKRKLGIVSRGGALTARWMEYHNCENPLYAEFDRLLEICAKNDVTLSLGDGLRPGCLADASDEAQFAELSALGELVARSRKYGVQCMVEGPGHIPMNEIKLNMDKEADICDGAPFYVLGPIVTDCAPGYDHITGAIGGAIAAMHGAAMLCYVTPKEHLGLPNERDVREGVTAFKIAAHAADIAHGNPGARQRDDAISDARAAFDWAEQFRLALAPEQARHLRREAVAEQTTVETNVEAETNAEADDRYCTMCGPKFCPMRKWDRST